MLRRRRSDGRRVRARSIAGVSSAEARGAAARLCSERGGEVIPALIAPREAHGRAVRDIHLSRPSLETLFISLTGRKLDMTDAARPSLGAVFLAILLRDVTVARRELPYFLLRTTLQPLLFVIVFGYLLPRWASSRGGYTTMMLPGILALSLTLSAIQSVALPMVPDFGFTKEIEDRLLAPVPIEAGRRRENRGRRAAGTSIAALFVLPLARLIMGPIPGLTFATFAPLLIVMTILGGAAFSALGLLLGTAIAAAADRADVQRRSSRR